MRKTTIPGITRGAWSALASLALLASLSCQPTPTPSAGNRPAASPAARVMTAPEARPEARRASPAARPVAGMRPATRRVGPGASSQPVGGTGTRQVRITPAEAQRNLLPPLTLSVDLGKSALSGRTYADYRTYLRLSGPPGGPLAVLLLAYGSRRHDDLMLEAIVRHELGKRMPAPFVPGAAEKVRLAGATRLARTALTGKSLARTSWCAVMVQAGTQSHGVLALFGVGHQGPKPLPCAKILAHPQLKPVIASLQVR